MSTRSGRRRLTGWLLVTVFVVVPIIEIYVLIQVGQVIGAWWTIALLVADSLLGSWLVRREGRRAWQALRSALDSGRLPSRELSDGALVVVGGTLMIAPGFVTDVLGFLVILPPTRPPFRRLLSVLAARRVAHDVPWPGRRPDSGRSGPGSETVTGEVVDDDR